MPTKYLAVLLVLFSAFALAAPPDAVDAAKSTANVFESSFFHLHYEFPKGWSALDDSVRVAENKKRYETAMQEIREQVGSDTTVYKAETVEPYFLLVAGRAAVTASETTQKPRVVIMATQRRTMMNGPGDPARVIMQMLHPKVLRQPEDIVLSGHKFYRVDFEFNPKSLLSKFATVVGDYIIEFDLRAENEKDLTDLVTTMQSLQISDK